MKFSKLPYILTFQIKRFDFNYQTLRRIKLNTKSVWIFEERSLEKRRQPSPLPERPPAEILVDNTCFRYTFPLELDMTPFMPGDQSSEAPVDKNALSASASALKTETNPAAEMAQKRTKVYSFDCETAEQEEPERGFSY